LQLRRCAAPACAPERAARRRIARVVYEFRPPDDVLGLAGVHPALPPIRLLHVGWRWYDPALGRFVQRDPMGLRGAVNLYLYCGGDGVKFVDPAGLGVRKKQTVIDRKRRRILVHVYDDPYWPWEKLLWEGPRYLGTAELPLVVDCVAGNNLYNDACKAAENHAIALVNVKNGMEREVQEAALEWLKEWAQKPLEPALDGAGRAAGYLP